jgi:hypothetical protein
MVQEVNMAEQAAEQAVNGEIPEADKAPRDQSKIKFAYLTLDDAVAMAVGVHETQGTTCQVDQLAAHLDLKPDTGSFRLRLGNAKLFGFITHSMGTITLTPLGSRICDPQQEQAAKAEAFLNVPLYKAIYEQFKGASLPPPAALEAAMVTLGVVTKQKAVARQVFVRSATQAGFFAFGPNRLVMPPIRGVAGAAAATLQQNGGTPTEPTMVEKPKGGYGSDDGGGGDCDPAIQGLIRRLPPPDSDWPLDKQARWLLAVSHAFDVIYPRDDDGRSLRIEIVKD